MPHWCNVAIYIFRRLGLGMAVSILEGREGCRGHLEIHLGSGMGIVG